MRLPWTAALLILLGGVLRLVELLRHRPLWLDEGMLALNLGARSFAELARPLDFDQTAPLLFLWLTKAVTLVAGMGESALRALPFAAGLLFPWVVWRMARAMAGPVEALIATALAAVSPSLVYFAAEFKPYGTDALVTAVLLLLTAELRRNPERGVRWWWLGIAGGFGFLLSTPAALVMAGVPLALLADGAVRRSPRWQIRWLLLAGAWAVAGFGIYWLTLRAAARSDYLVEFWRGSFLAPFGPRGSEQFYGLVQSVLDPLPAVEFLRVRWWVLVCGLGGIVLTRRWGMVTLIQIAAPLVALVAASVLQKYPIAHRLLVFAAPCVFFLLAVLVAELLRLVRLGEPARGLAGAAAVLVWAAPSVVSNIRTPRLLTEGRESVRHILSTAPANPVYLLPGGLAAWVYYSTDWRHPDRDRIAHYARAVSYRGPGAANVLVSEAPGDSGDALMYRAGPRLELLARRSGIAYREPEGLYRSTPDSGWVEAEVSRLIALGVPEVSLYGVHWTTVLLPVFRAELTRRGIEVTDSFFELEAVALRLRIPVSAAPPPLSRTAPP